MALYDSADLLARFVRQARLPAVREAPTDADIYAYLTEGQLYWTEQLAVHVPEAVWSAPTKLVSVDGGLTYPLPSEPVGPLQLLAARGGTPLLPGPEWDDGTDYVLEGQTVRFPGGRSRTFSDGPYARIVAMPGEIDADSQPSLPTKLRRLILYRALVLWASEPTSGADPNTFLNLEQDAWTGRADDPADVGLLGELKVQHLGGYGAGGGGGKWWRSSDLGT